MIFISGIHGVGKSYFCEMVKSVIGVATFSASQLISERKKSGFSKDKLIPDIDDNQQYLLDAVRYLNATYAMFLLDGHFCLLNAKRKVTRIPQETFIDLKPDAIIILTEKPEVIATRRKQRDNISYDENEIQEFQNEEIAYATEVARTLGVPIKVSLGAGDLNNTLNFIRTIMGRVTSGR